MARFISVFISASHRNAIALLLWAAMLVLTFGTAGWSALQLAGESMLTHAAVPLEQFVRLRQSVSATFEALAAEVVAEPCSNGFHEQLRKIAYRPDGLSEFLYAPGDAIQCSIDRDFAVPVVLGPPDLERARPAAASMWFDQDLTFLGLAGLKGSIIIRGGGLGMIVPDQEVETPMAEWMSQEVVLAPPGGRSWHRGGTPGLYEEAVAAEASWLPIYNGAIHRRSCDPAGYHCVAMRASIADIARSHPATVLFIGAVCAALAAWLASMLAALLRRYWAFEARFRRHFSAESVLCNYQPIMHLESGAITGCEVLVRWRDVDGSIVFPDQFLDIVERHGLTMQLTRYVVERARKDLAAAVPAGQHFQINFNIFPCDLEAAALLEVLAAFDDTAGRFELAVEIVESTALDLEAAQREVALLQRAGIGTYLDDFGTGHSNIHHLAALSLDGVKLDRSFAMAPDESLMGQMLGNAIHMIHVSGRPIVIEGVETEERLAMLRATGQVDYVQGYLISRPLDAERLSGFLARRTMERPRLVA